MYSHSVQVSIDSHRLLFSATNKKSSGVSQKKESTNLHSVYTCDAEQYRGSSVLAFLA
jgi:hypothetical protein